MKNFKIILIFLLGLSIISCKKKYEREFSGPEINTNGNLVKPFVVSTPIVDFKGTDSNSLAFKGKFSVPVRWKITIKGSESSAEKHFTGYSDSIPSTLVWNGSQDSLYYFRANETCEITLAVDNSYRSTSVSDNLEVRGDINVSDVIVGRQQVKIRSTKKAPSTQMEAFPQYNPDFGFTEAEYYSYLADGNVGYDQESGKMEDKDADVPFIGTTPKFIFQDPKYVPLSKTGGGVRGKTYMMLKGTDKTSLLDAGVPDYYIGRMASISLTDIDVNVPFFFNNFNVNDSLKTKSPDQVYFNVFIYGTGDGSTVNYTVKEDKGGPGGLADTLKGDGTYRDPEDESFEKAIKVDFLGWKLFSFKYTDFLPAKYKSPDNIPSRGIKRGDLIESNHANHKREPKKILQIQFSLVAPSKGGSGRAIIDNPVISWNGPLKY